MIVGLTGSVGSGKSTVARMLQELADAKIIDADAIARDVQSPGGAAYEEIVEAFGREILNDDGTIDRAKLAAIVFGDRTKLERLNAIVHPKVRARELALLQEYRNEPLVVLMVPLLLENKLQDWVDSVVVVVADEEVRRERLRRRSGWTDSEITRRSEAQMPDREKVRLADYVIDNSGTLDETRRQVKRMLASMKAQATHRRS